MTIERRNHLDKFIQLLQDQYTPESPLKLNFICTHNSRRSQLAEVLTFLICQDLGLSNIQSFSGGTEATAFNHRMVHALKTAGINIEAISEGNNPHYRISANDATKECFSKKYDDPYNPQTDFIAITVCSDAEENCPVVFGARARFHLPYLDPKAFDDTDQESLKHSEKVEELHEELSYVFNEFKKHAFNG